MLPTRGGERLFTYIHPIQVKKRPLWPSYAKKVPLFDGFYYYSLDFPCVNGNFDWQGLCVDGRALVPKDLPCPSTLKTFGTDIWRCVLTVRLLCDTIKNERCDLAVTDPDGRLLACVKKLCPYARSVSVFTKAPHLYDDIRQEILRESGQYIAVNTAAGLNNGYSFSPFSPPAPGTEGLYRIDLSNLRENAVYIPPNWLSVMPTGVSRIAFGEVLYTALKIGRISDYLAPGSTLF